MADHHAYLILAYKNTYVLQKTIRLLDYKDNDIYFHIDKKADINEFYSYKNSVKNAGVYFTRRVEVNWAAFSMVEAMLILFEESLKNGSYSYFHLLSESDMPIKSQRYIHSFLQGKNYDLIEMCGVSKKKGLKTFSTAVWNRYYYWFTETQLYRKSRIHKFFVRIALILPQKILKINRWKGEKNLKGKDIFPTWGWQWVSLTENTVKFILSKKEYIFYHFKNTHAPDECAIPTLIYNFTDLKNVRPSKRNIVFTGKPSIITMNDYDRLMNSDDFFARKFDEKIDKEVIDKIFDRVMESENEQ